MLPVNIDTPVRSDEAPADSRELIQQHTDASSPLPIKQGRYIENYRSGARNIFIGFDARQVISYQVCALSAVVFSVKSTPAIIPLKWDCLPINRHGLTPFTFSRFLVPWLMNYEGYGLFCDPDALFMDDVEELFEIAKSDPSVPIWVVPKKGECAFEQSAFMMFNCAHPDCKTLTPEKCNDNYWNPLKLDWASEIGEFPQEWHHIVLYEPTDPNAKWVHFTAGVPGFPECKDVPLAEKWLKMSALTRLLRPWKEIMGPSVHVQKVLDHLAQKKNQASRFE